MRACVCVIPCTSERGSGVNLVSSGGIQVGSKYVASVATQGRPQTSCAARLYAESGCTISVVLNRTLLVELAERL